jgi:HPt (histidine-containing phosphotransfer) domain-containing protein
LTDALQFLRTRFLARARDDLAIIDGKLRGEALPPESLRLLVHRLAGAGGTFGYQAISQAAGDVEDLLLQERDPAEALLRLQGVLARDLKSAQGNSSAG